MSGVMPIIKSRYETGFKKVSQQQKERGHKMASSEKVAKDRRSFTCYCIESDEWNSECG